MQDGSVITPRMRDALGVDSEPRTHVVEQGAVRRFADAIGDPDPVYRDEEVAGGTRHGGIVAPPTFLRSLEPGPARAALDLPYPEVLDGGSEWELVRPVSAGERITVTSRVADLRERTGRLGPMLLVVRETSFADESGGRVAVERSTYIYYDPASTEGGGE